MTQLTSAFLYIIVLIIRILVLGIDHIYEIKDKACRWLLRCCQLDRQNSQSVWPITLILFALEIKLTHKAITLILKFKNN